MKIFLDSANLNEIKEAVSWADILRMSAFPSATTPLRGVVPASVRRDELVGGL